MKCKRYERQNVEDNVSKHVNVIRLTVEVMVSPDHLRVIKFQLTKRQKKVSEFVEIKFSSFNEYIPI